MYLVRIIQNINCKTYYLFRYSICKHDYIHSRKNVGHLGVACYHINCFTEHIIVKAICQVAFLKCFCQFNND